MANRNKFEEMLERLINEDTQGAEELFHEIVVEKSRSIYESLLDSEFDEDYTEEYAAEADEPMIGGDETDDFIDDVEVDSEEGEEDEGEEDEGDMEDRVVDLEDALDELKAEFEKLMADEAGEEHAEESDEDEDEATKQEGYDYEEDEAEESYAGKKSESEQMREYVEKVAAKMGDNGANTKSTVAGKNDMGGTASNIATGKSEAGVEAGKGQLKGSGLLKGTAKEDNAGNINVPGGKASKAAKAAPSGHGAEKKGAGETAANKNSIIGSK
jgi:hypothetical protein